MNGADALTEHIRASDALLQELLSHAKALRHDGSDAQLHALSLYGTTLELFSGCIVLAKAGEPVGIPILLRPMYEALVDLDNLLRNASYVEHLEAANLKQMLKLLSALSRNNPLLEGFSDETPEQSQAMAVRYEALKAARKRPLTIEERCRRVGRLEEYETLYALYCLDSHNSGAALAERHLTDQPSGVPLVSFFALPEPQTVARRLEFGMGTVMQAGQMVHSAFRTDSDRLEACLTLYRRQRAERLTLLQAKSE